MEQQDWMITLKDKINMIPNKKNKKEFICNTINETVLWAFENHDKDLDIDMVFVKLTEKLGPEISVDVMTRVSNTIKDEEREVSINDALRELTRIAYRMEQ